MDVVKMEVNIFMVGCKWLVAGFGCVSYVSVSVGARWE